MKKAISVWCMVAILLILAIYEFIAVKNILGFLADSVDNILPMYESNHQDITVILDDVQYFQKKWTKLEDGLCLMFNHKDLGIVTNSLNKLLVYTKNNDFNNAIVEVYLLKTFSDKSEHIMGFDINNVF